MIKKGLILKKNLLVVLSIVLICLSGVLACFIFANNANTHLQIDYMEESNISESKTSVEESFEQLSSMAIYYATTTIYDISENFTIDGYYKNYAIEKQIDIMFSVMNSLGSLTVESPKFVISTDNTFDLNIVKENARVISNINGVDIMYIKDANVPYNLFFVVKRDNFTSYINNNVYIGIDQYNLSNSVYQDSDFDLRQEFLVSNDEIVLLGKQGNTSIHFDEFINSYTIDELFTNKKTTLQNEGKFVYCKKLENTDLFQVNIVNRDSYSSFIAERHFFQFAMSIIIFLIGIGGALFITRYTYKPIKSLVNQIEIYDRQKLNSKIDETNFISNKFEELVLKNEELSNTVFEKIQDLKYQQGRALQSQINPHFIYNSLDALNWMVAKRLNQYDNDISKTINNISSIIHSSLDDNNLIHTIQDEIDILNINIDVLNTIYNNKFNFKIECDDDILNNIILKLSVQPLLENAITHGFVDTRKGGNILIKFESIGSNICVSVTDDGVGMKKEKIRELVKNINTFDKNANKNIGLRNTNLRLKLMFGEQYGILIRSKYGEETTVSFKVPRDEKLKF